VNFSVDLIRTLAILSVIFNHAVNVGYGFSGSSMPIAIANWWTIDAYRSIGNFGVPLFVMLTGILLLTPSKCDEPIGVFFKKRFARIGVPMIFWTAAYFAWGYYFNGYPLTPMAIFEGLLGGSYYHLGFLYILIGLYLATPILRIVVKNIDRQRFTYFLGLWVVGNFAVPFIQLFIGYKYNPVLFVFTGWVGFYLLGVYLMRSKVRSWILYVTVALGLLGSVLGDYVVTLYTPQFNGFFHEYLIFTIVAATGALFLLLLNVPKNRFDNHVKFNSVLHWVSQNTLPIYLFHVMLLELIEVYLGWQLDIFALPSVLQIPVLTVLTFTATCLILYPLLKVPFVKRIIG
jgi:surface polysaccharide O-acyltransferase-like enzyme